MYLDYDSMFLVAFPSLFCSGCSLSSNRRCSYIETDQIQGIFTFRFYSHGTLTLGKWLPHPIIDTNFICFLLDAMQINHPRIVHLCMCIPASHNLTIFLQACHVIKCGDFRSQPRSASGRSLSFCASNCIKTAL